MLYYIASYHDTRVYIYIYIYIYIYYDIISYYSMWYHIIVLHVCLASIAQHYCRKP